MSDGAIKLKQEHDEAKKQHLLSCSSQSKARWRQINASLNDAYQADKAEKLSKQLKEFRIADGSGLQFHNLSGNYKNSNLKVKKIDDTPTFMQQNWLSSE